MITDQAWTVHDYTGVLDDRKFASEEQAMKWVQHLFEWQPRARPRVIPPEKEQETKQ